MKLLKLFILLPLLMNVTGCDEKKESLKRGDEVLNSFYNKKIEKEKQEKERIEKEKKEKERIEKEKIEKIELDKLKKIEEEKAAAAEAERIANLDPFKNYEEIDMDTENVHKKKALENVIVEYEVMVDGLRSKFIAQKEKLNNNIQKNKEQLEKILVGVKNNYNIDCKEVLMENIQKCKSLGINKLDLELKIKALENSIKHSNEKLSEIEVIELEKYKEIMLKNIKMILKD